MIDDDHFYVAQEEERNWWGDCANTFHEEEKQFVYARLMGLEFERDEHSPYNIFKHGMQILDIGGGPSSLLLKTKGLSEGIVYDPCRYPDWVSDRYYAHGVALVQDTGESMNSTWHCDEIWMYNCLQHAMQPDVIIQNGINALAPGGVFRVFEWINTETNEAHPHSLTAEFLDEQFSSDGEHRRGHVVHLAESGCYGDSYSGAFIYPKKGEK